MSNRNLKLVVLAETAIAILILLVLLLVLSNRNNDSSTGSNTPTPTVSSTPSTSPSVSPTTTTTADNAVKIYFGKDPDSFSDSSQLFPVERTPGENKVQSILSELLKGPTAEEKGQGLFAAFSLSGDSTCGGSFYQFSRSGNKLKIKFCKDINEKTEGTAGSTLRAQARTLLSLEKSLSVDGITSIEVRDKNDECYGMDAGSINVCE